MELNHSKIATWSGTILKSLLVIFLLFDAIMKIIRHPEYVKGTIEFGFSQNIVQPLGVCLLVATVLYIVPRTKIFGSLLLTAYLGGAVATTILANQSYIFPIVFTVLIWLAEYLRNQKIRSFLFSN